VDAHPDAGIHRLVTVAAFDPNGIAGDQVGPVLGPSDAERLREPTGS
jgi:hypothetical protein